MTKRPAKPAKPTVALPTRYAALLADIKARVRSARIEAGLHIRQGKAVTNFKTTLPPAQSDLAQGITKDPHLFEMMRTETATGSLPDRIPVRVGART